MRIGEMSALFAPLAVAGVIAGCAPSAAAPQGASPSRSHASGDSTLAAARVFSSRLYGYTEALPAGWSGVQAAQRWDGTSVPGFGDTTVDRFHGPSRVVTWGFVMPPRARSAADPTAAARAATGLSCQAPQTGQEITIAGAPALMAAMHCPSQGGFFVLTATTTGKRAALVFAFEDSSGEKAAEQADLLAFRQFLAGIGVQRQEKG